MNVDTGERGSLSKPRNLPDLGETQKNITMAAIAKASGVSQGAISSLLNDRDYGIRVSEKTRNLVFKVCREMGYVPNDLRAVVRMYPELGDFCVLVASSCALPEKNPSLARVLGAAMTSGGVGQITLAEFEDGLDYSGSAKLPQPLQVGVASKFILFGKPNLSLIEAIVGRGYRVFCVDNDVGLPGVTTYLPDYEQAARLGLEHLFGLGHSEVLIISGNFGSSDYRIDALKRGTRAAFEKLGLQVQTQNVMYGDLDFESGRAAVQEILSRKNRPTAVFCFSDAAAAGFISGANAAGISIPSEMSVVGCSDDPFASFLAPALTTVHIPFEAMAKMAVAGAQEAAAQETADLTSFQKVVVPIKLVNRASTAER